MPSSLYRITFIVSLFFFFINSSFAALPLEDAANGFVKGRVLSSDKQPLPGVTVSLKGTQTSTTTDNNGYFKLKSTAGNYTIQFTFIGLQPVGQLVTITSGKTLNLPDVLLSGSYAQLQEVVISTAKKNNAVTKESGYVARMPLKNLENPQVYTVIPKELLKEQVIVDYSQALANTTGAVSGAKAGNGENFLMLRGFADPGFIRNGLTSPQYTDVDPANLERIEVIKGPSGTLFGSAQISYGGLVNRVTKKPLASTFADVSYSAGSFGLGRFTADVNAPINKDSTALFRLNAASHHEGSFQDYGETQNYFVAPVFTYKINSKLDLLIEGEYYTRKATSTPILTIPATSGITSLDQLNSIYKKSFLTDEIAFKGTVTNFNAQLNYKLSSSWTSSSNLATSHTDYDYPFLASTVASDTLITRAAGKTYYDLNFLELQENVNGKFFIAGMQNRLLAGIDYLQRRHTFYSSRAAYDKLNYLKSGGAYVGIDQFNAAISKLTYTPSKPNSNTYGIYISDVIDLTSRLNVMGSLRYDDYVDNGTANYKQGSLSPKLGIVYQLVKNSVSLFGNYMNGFNNVSSVDKDGNAFKPQHANQCEGGVKAEYLGGKISSTISYYYISVENILRADPLNSGFSIQDGTQKSKGLEAELIGNPIEGLNIIAGYGLNDSRYTKSNPAVQGHRPALVPNNTLNYWVNYTISQGDVKGLGFGAGGNYYGQNYFDDANIVSISSANLLGASVFYNQPKYRLSFKADNLTNQKYWVSSTPQMPLRVIGSIELKF